MSVPFSNTNLRVPRGFANLLEGLTREVLREQPRDIPLFATRYFETLLKQRQEMKFDAADWGASLDDRFYNNHAFSRGEINAPSSASAALPNGARNGISPLREALHTDRSLHSPDVEEKEECGEDATQKAAATVIQATYRGHLARGKVKKLKESAKHNSVESILVNSQSESVCRDEETGAHSPDPTEPGVLFSPEAGRVTLIDPCSADQELSDPVPDTAAETQQDETHERESEHEDKTSESHTVQGDVGGRDGEEENSHTADTQEADMEQEDLLKSEMGEHFLSSETPGEEVTAGEHVSDLGEPRSGYPHVIQGDTCDQPAGGDTDLAETAWDSPEPIQDDTRDHAAGGDTAATVMDNSPKADHSASEQPAGGDTDLAETAWDSAEVIQGDPRGHAAGGDTAPTVMDNSPKADHSASEQPAGGDTDLAETAWDSAEVIQGDPRDHAAGGDTAATVMDNSPKADHSASEQPAGGDTVSETNENIVSSEDHEEDPASNPVTSVDLPVSEEESPTDRNESLRKQQDEALDIPLDDPDANAAAAKIQAGFRGHMTRKKMKSGDRDMKKDSKDAGSSQGGTDGD